MGYLHYDITACQSAKAPHPVCGDVVWVERTPGETWLVVADGIGSGALANLAASMCASRLVALLEQGVSLREAFAHIVETMRAWREPGQPYAAFTVARLRPNGEVRVLSYEAPPPILLTRHDATVPRQRHFEYEGATIEEASMTLAPGDGLLVTSDGITQAGLGNGLAEGWGTEGVRWFATEHVTLGRPPLDLAERVHQRARAYWGATAGDDCTAVVAYCRPGEAVTVLTGPPEDRRRDAAVIDRFLEQEGAKVVCGGTTAQLVARHTGQPLAMREESLNAIAPPYYALDGIDLVTEGAVTLNHAYNLLDAPAAALEPDSGASALCERLRDADRVHFIVGRAQNIATGHISFRQQGILTREKIVDLLVQALRTRGKTVSVELI